jgi:hypothetical protein
VSRSTGRGKAEGFDALVRLSRERRYASVPELDFENVVYIGRSSAPVRIDPAMAHRAGLVINVGDAMLEMPGQPITNLHRGYLRTIALIVAACAALNESGPSKVPEAPPAVGDTVLWTFERKDFPANRRLRVRVRGSGYVHAGRVGADGSWDPVYNVPLIPLTVGGYEAVLPAGVDRFTFFWTETPWTPGHPGHWEPATNGPSTFQAVMSSAGLRPRTTTNSD